VAFGNPKIVTRSGDGFTLHIGAEERAVVAGLLVELQAMQTDPDAADAVARLFPVVHPSDPVEEEEWQRLMREELVTSRSSAIDTVVAVLERPGRKVPVTADEMHAFVQAVNSIRLVLGTVLDVGEDEEDVSPTLLQSPEYGLYGYLSFVLDASVRVLSGS
jgi:hypothetical protein